MGIWYPRYHIIPEGANPFTGELRMAAPASLLASRKGVTREGRSEGSGTAKPGTDEQERHTEAG
jgi:hypothetical protein